MLLEVMATAGGVAGARGEHWLNLEKILRVSRVDDSDPPSTRIESPISCGEEIDWLDVVHPCSEVVRVWSDYLQARELGKPYPATVSLIKREPPAKETAPPTTAKESCPSCGLGYLLVSKTVDRVANVHTARRGVIGISYDLPYSQCPQCSRMFIPTPETQIQRTALHRHLKLLTPAELTAMPARHGMTLDDFATLIGFEANYMTSLVMGQDVQTDAEDKLFRLVDSIEPSRLQEVLGINK